MTLHLAQWILGIILIFSASGVILLRKPVHACLSFLLTLLMLASLYLLHSAEFIAVMQVLVYAGAILVIFMFVIVLFQDAHAQLELHPPKSSPYLLGFAACLFILSLVILGFKFATLKLPHSKPLENFGTVQDLGKTLYVDFFIPFEIVVVLFLVALVGSLYIGKRER